MVGGIRDLTELSYQGGSVHAECLVGGRVTIFSPWELASHFQTRGWSTLWPGFAVRLRCSGCGANGPRVRWSPKDPPPADPHPPPPRFTRESMDQVENVVPIATARRRRRVR